MDPIWSHTDYRKWMRAWLEAQRLARPSVVSSRWMALRLSIDPSLFSKILAAERHIATSQVEPICELTGLAGDEAEYFRILVQYGKAKGHKEAQSCFRRMAQLRKVSPVPLEGVQSAYWQNWENLAIRELMSCGDVKDDPETIARRIRPTLSARRVRQSLSILSELGLATLDERGIWRRSEPFLRDGPNVDPAVLRHFHKESLLLAAEAIESVPKELRDLSSLTLAIPENGYPQLVELLKEFRQRILATISGMDKPDRVYQLGLHLIPRALPDSDRPDA
ncbi:MAG: TIGR02147 family protein [Fibrobacterota bacterium]|nr:TIGR02147 family protein [Fibrobacterota bacterium]QQS04683.1 MAG: TIGR02147 family protein [Fibrobacterota bacterium]